jgi:enoyl-CoA hydratase/carnithine racemase
MNPPVEVRVNQQQGTIVLNRPDRRNALSRELLAQLDEALGDLHQEKRVRAVVITGAGAAFCAGMDLEEMQATAQLPDPHAQWGEDARVYCELIFNMLRFPKPIIAAINGPAVAGGAGLALAADVVIAAPTAKFGLPEPRRGVIAGMVSPLLAFRIGGGQAARLLITSASIEAAEAHRIGVYHEVVAADELLTRAAAIAADCARGAPEAIQLTKRMINETIGARLFTELTAGAAASATARTTEAAAEGLAAFFDKRDPVWK